MRRRALLSVGQAQATRGFLSATGALLKKSGKPLDIHSYKQVYLPYDEPPTEAELDRERKRFAKARGPYRFKEVYYEVVDIPENMYTYGKEGMSVPISIFKDQPDPVVAAEHTYPGIYENKIALRHLETEELIDLKRRGAFETPIQEGILFNRTMRAVRATSARITHLRDREDLKLLRDRKGPSAGKTKAPGKK
jgi:hypothetical protein